MQVRALAAALIILACTAGFAPGQAPTPAPVDSNVGVGAFAQSVGSPCSGGRGSAGCGGCYPSGLASGLLGVLSEENPEWAPIGPMVPGLDSSSPPNSQPVLMTGTVALTKINIEGDFSGSHVGDDQNTFIILDADKSGLLATGNSESHNCPGEGCNAVEMELEIEKYPLFAWAGEGDRIAALGRWIFDCGHPDPAPLGQCSNSSSPCKVDQDCAGGTCSNPSPNYQFNAELHPPLGIAVLRNKSKGSVPATRADVYVSADTGGAGDTCTVSHLADFNDLLTAKHCFLNHCSVTTDRSCLANSDCAAGETCLRTDPNASVFNINSNDFEFDMPLPPKPAGATDVTIKTAKMKVPKGNVMPPKPTIVKNLTSPTPSLHVTVPMTVPVGGKMPNVFAQSITAAWKKDKTKLTQVLVQLTGITINNPLKISTPPLPRVCTNPSGGLTSTACTDNSTCPTGGTCAKKPTKSCHVNADCAATDHCVGGSQCVGGTTPGWDMFVEVNGDWVQLKGLGAIGSPALTPPPIYPLSIPQKFSFKEYVPAGGAIHIATTGHSLACVDTLYGLNLGDALGLYGFVDAASCLVTATADDHNPGRVDVTYNGPLFGTSATQTPTTFSTTSSGGSAGSCSVTTSRLCVDPTDCPTGETCNVTGGAFSLTYTITVK